VTSLIHFLPQFPYASYYESLSLISLALSLFLTPWRLAELRNCCCHPPPCDFTFPTTAISCYIEHKDSNNVKVWIMVLFSSLVIIISFFALALCVGGERVKKKASSQGGKSKVSSLWDSKSFINTHTLNCAAQKRVPPEGIGVNFFNFLEARIFLKASSTMRIGVDFDGCQKAWAGLSFNTFSPRKRQTFPGWTLFLRLSLLICTNRVNLSERFPSIALPFHIRNPNSRTSSLELKCFQICPRNFNFLILLKHFNFTMARGKN
jgi:hypothetical protein